jgi:Putative beta-barrel porin 2
MSAQRGTRRDAAYARRPLARQIGRISSGTVFAIGVLSVLPGNGASAQMTAGTGRDYAPMVVGEFLVYPELRVGAVYDDNIFNDAAETVGALGASIEPEILMKGGNGLHDIDLYGQGLAKIYPGASGANTYTGQLGFANLNSIGEDLSLRLDGEIGRLTDNLKAQSSTLRSQSRSVSADSYDQYLASMLIHKIFNRVWLEGGFDLTVQDRQAGLYKSGNVRARAGLDLSSDLSIYLESSYIAQRLQDRTTDSDGYRLIFGASSSRIGLFRGEIYAGLLVQNYPHIQGATRYGPTAGGDIAWMAKPELTVTAALSEALGLEGPQQNSAFSLLGQIPGSSTPSGTGSSGPAQIQPGPTVGTPQQLFAFGGSAGKVTTAALSVSYTPSEAIAVSGTFAYQHQEAAAGQSGDDVWSSNISIVYSLTPTITADLDYLYSYSRLNATNASLSHEIVTLSLGMKF